MAQYCPTCGHSQADRSSSPLFGVVDPVTGIWNSKFINALIGQEANRAIRYHRPLSVLVVELDHAEHIHKELAPIQIEALLREMSERLGQAIRDTDTVALPGRRRTSALRHRPARNQRPGRDAGGRQDPALDRDSTTSRPPATGSASR